MNPHHVWEADPDPRQSEKPDPDSYPHRNEKPGAVEAHNEAMEAHPGTVSAPPPFTLITIT